MAMVNTCSYSHTFKNTNIYSEYTIATCYYCTSSLCQRISCKMQICILGMAINFQTAPIVMKLNFNYSF